MKICYSIALALMPFVPLPSLVQATEQLPSKPINYQVCTLTVNTQTGEATSVCSPVYKCTSTGSSSEKLGKISTHRDKQQLLPIDLALVSVDKPLRLR